MTDITPSIWFTRTAAEAAAFYTSVFPDSAVTATTFYPSEGLPDFQRSFAGQVLTVDMELAGLPFTAINAGDEFAPTPAISFIVNWDPSVHDDAEAGLDRMWQALLDGGSALMPLREYPFSRRYGWVQDRYGVSWQLMLTDPAGEPRPMIVPSLMFGNDRTGSAEDALTHYLGLFPDSRQGTLVRYPERSGRAAAGSVMFADALLAGRWFAAMDAGTPQPFDFTPGVSLVVHCSDQDEIDRYWNALSHVPEDEACGWCTDRFGVSWQIVPADMAELMTRPDAHNTLLSMTRIIIDRF
ncbi:VOC family protein [Mycetocola reblochoni]|uniref:3-demethylubiquinone-9 3-methyltransferase n=2 Tax=Mycetocola reblochoni TaxID=331618 RepID=A0A1R4K5E6_9MICO|nr:VOC family protein [Mycetocola reblochoni]RLP68016.1 VOC family protein [Mycetocola reblochoni]SJN39590.1 3-demethylubiquinone-9 3-methyltransferase [Mycetocola reblochoni REB411]